MSKSLNKIDIASVQAVSLLVLSLYPLWTYPITRVVFLPLQLIILSPPYLTVIMCNARQVNACVAITQK